MSDHAGMGSMQEPWTTTDFLHAVTMWAVMMIGMMLPSATPVILLFAAIQAKGGSVPASPGKTTLFGLGYLIVWGGFSVLAAAAQWALHDASQLSARVAVTSGWLSAAVLVAAGVYQLTPLKAVCLTHCRNPFSLFMTYWREGPGGALRMGARHGWYCLGCCWLLMGLLFVMGVMNLGWVAAIAAFVLLEKVGPGGVWIGRVAAVAMIAGGIVVAARLAM